MIYAIAYLIFGFILTSIAWKYESTPDDEWGLFVWAWLLWPLFGILYLIDVLAGKAKAMVNFKNPITLYLNWLTNRT